MMRRVVVLAAGLVAATSAAVRADSLSVISTGIQSGTLGAGLTFERALLFDLSARVQTGNWSSSEATTYDATPFTETWRQSHVLVALDWRPSAARLRLSGGLLFGSDRVDDVARNFNGNYTINGSVYSAAQAGQVSGRVAFNRPGIYLGAGIGTGIIKGFSMAFDAGLLVRNGVASANATGPAAATPALQADLAAFAGRFRTRVITPVVQIGVTYRP